LTADLIATVGVSLGMFSETGGLAFCVEVDFLGSFILIGGVSEARAQFNFTETLKGMGQRYSRHHDPNSCMYRQGFGLNCFELSQYGRNVILWTDKMQGRTATTRTQIETKARLGYLIIG
jgi:hypothetical protein